MIRLVLCVILLAAGTVASAQGNRFAPVIQVGNDVVTGYMLDQRTRFLTLLRAPEPRRIAREQLINEAIQLAAARDNGIVVSDEDLQSGLNEFASQADLSAEEFIAALGANGVDAETYRDFIEAGVAWRTLLRARFGEDIRASLPAALITKRLAQSGTEGGVRLLLSEIWLPADTLETRRASLARADQLRSLNGEDAFATAARRFSTADSRAVGGELDWVALEALPPEVASAVSGLAEGQVSRLVDRGESLTLYLLRDRETVPAGAPGNLAIDYALFITGPDTPSPEAVADRVDVCDDLYGVAKGLPPSRLVRETTPQAQLPSDIARALAPLDEGEVSTALTRGGQRTVLMLCSRAANFESTVDRNIVGTRLLNQRLGATAEAYLAELRAGTVIIDLDG